MSVPVRIDLGDGESVVLDAVDNDEERWRPAGPADVLERSVGQFETAVRSGVRVYEMVRRQFDASEAQYAKGSLQIGLSLTAGGDIKIVKFQGEGSLNLTIDWIGTV